MSHIKFLPTFRAWRCAEFGKRQAGKRKPIKDMKVWYMLVLLIEKRRPETTAQR